MYIWEAREVRGMNQWRGVRGVHPIHTLPLESMFFFHFSTRSPWTYKPTDGPTDRRTDKAAYRVACPQVKRYRNQLFGFSDRPTDQPIWIDVDCSAAWNLVPKKIGIHKTKRNSCWFPLGMQIKEKNPSFLSHVFQNYTGVYKVERLLILFPPCLWFSSPRRVMSHYKIYDFLPYKAKQAQQANSRVLSYTKLHNFILHT